MVFSLQVFRSRLCMYFSSRLQFLYSPALYSRKVTSWQANASIEEWRRYTYNPFTTTALKGDGWSAPHSGPFTPGKETRYPLYIRLGGPQGLSGRAWKTSPTSGFDPRNVQPVASCYTDWAISVATLLYVLCLVNILMFEVKLILCKPWRHIGEAEVQVHSFLISAPDGGEWPASRPSRFIS